MFCLHFLYLVAFTCTQQCSRRVLAVTKWRKSRLDMLRISLGNWVNLLSLRPCHMQNIAAWFTTWQGQGQLLHSECCICNPRDAAVQCGCNICRRLSFVMAIKPLLLPLTVCCFPLKVRHKIVNFTVARPLTLYSAHLPAHRMMQNWHGHLLNDVLAEGLRMSLLFPLEL